MVAARAEAVRAEEVGAEMVALTEEVVVGAAEKAVEKVVATAMAEEEAKAAARKVAVKAAEAAEQAKAAARQVTAMAAVQTEEEERAGCQSFDDLSSPILGKERATRMRLPGCRRRPSRLVCHGMAARLRATRRDLAALHTVWRGSDPSTSAHRSPMVCSCSSSDSDCSFLLRRGRSWCGSRRRRCECSERVVRSSS